MTVQLEVLGHEVLATYESGYWERYFVAHAPMPEFEEELEEVESEFVAQGYEVEWTQ